MNQSNRIEEKLDIILDLLKRLPDKIEPIQKVIQRPTTDSQEREFEEGATEPERWKPEVRQMYWVAHSNRESVHPDIWEDKTQDWDWFNNDQIRKTESEALERSKELNQEREAAETESPDTGNDAPITPAGPLRVMPEILDYFYCVDFYKTMGGEIKFNIPRRRWTISSDNLNLFQSGLCFRYSPEGKLGAERRASEGVRPPIDRKELHRMYRRIIDATDEAETPVVDLLIYLQSILEGGENE